MKGSLAPSPSARARRRVVARGMAFATIALLALGCPPRATTPRPATSARCPGEMAYVEAPGLRAFCIDRWEDAVTEGGETHSPYEPVTADDARAVSKEGVVPQGYISQLAARSACEHAGKRLCAADEWQRACRGPDDTQFPYGAERHRGYCNDHGHAPLAALYPDGSYYSSPVAMNDPRINRTAGTVAETGSHARCTNGYGVYDMVGNLHEWTAEVSGTHGTFRGGYYQDTMQNGAGCGYRTTAHALEYHDYSIGFRCCADAK